MALCIGGFGSRVTFTGRDQFQMAPQQTHHRPKLSPSGTDTVPP